MVDRTPEEQQLLQAFGRRVRDVRMARGESQADLAHRADMHPTYLSSVERGQRNISLVNIHLLAHALGISAADLVG